MTLSRNIADMIVRKGVKIADVEDSLRSYKLLSLLPSIRKAVEEMHRAESRKEAIDVESPFELDERALARIKRIVGNDLAPHTLTINKNLLAGFKARYRGTLYDGSAERIVRQLQDSH
jgi:F0F1-type ATP synthase delta subunit